MVAQANEGSAIPDRNPAGGGGELTVEVFLRNPVKVVTRSTGNVVTDSTVSDHLSERSDAGVGFKSRGDQFG